MIKIDFLIFEVILWFQKMEKSDWISKNPSTQKIYPKKSSSWPAQVPHIKKLSTRTQKTIVKSMVTIPFLVLQRIAIWAIEETAFILYNQYG